MKEEIKIVSIKDIGELSKYEKGWDSLIFNSNGKKLYVTFPYIYERVGSFDAKKTAKILLAVKHGELVGVLPLINDNSWYNFGSNVYKFCGEGLWGYADILLHKDYEHVVYDALINYVYANLRFGRIEFGPLHEKSISISLLTKDRRHKYKIRETLQDAPNIYTNALSYEEHIKNKGNIKSITSDIERCKRRLSEMGKIEFSTINNISQIHALEKYLGIYYSLYNKQRANTSRFLRIKHYGEFYTKLAVAALKKQYFELSILTLNGKPIAFEYGFLIKKIRYYFTPTYDIDYVKYSPGKILLQHIIKDSFDKGYEFDFMNGIHKYNLEWSNNIQKRIYVHVFSNAVYYYYYKLQKYILQHMMKIGKYLKKRS